MTSVKMAKEKKAMTERLGMKGGGGKSSMVP